jgi:hypothetical protein
MIRSFSHDAAKPSRSNVGSGVQRPPLVMGVDVTASARLVAMPVNFLGGFLIKLVQRVVSGAKVAQPVITFVMVDVVNHFRLITICQKPSQPVTKVLPVVVGNLNVTTFADRSSNAPRLDASASIDKPDQISCFRIVAQDIADRFRDTFASHIKPPFDVVRGLRIAVLSTPILSLSLTACTSAEVRDAHMQNQIRMVQVQKEADSKLAIAEANAKVALYEALADVARTNPEQASAVVVAMAIQGVGQEKEDNDSRVVPLQPLQNETLEYARVFAAPLMNATTAVATAYINADVAKRQSDNAARVQVTDALQDSRIVEAVAGVGMAAASQTGITVSGNYNQMSDSASISQDTFSTTTQTSTSTSTITETVSSSETSIADSYNTDSSVTDSYNSSDSSVTDNSITDNSTNPSTINNDNSVVTYEGQEFTLPNLLSYLQGTGLAYSLTLGDTVYTIDGEGDPAEIDCGGDPVFSPAPPLPVDCSGG